MNKSLLFVDDEKQILKAIRRLFLDTDFAIYTTDSGEEALQILNDTMIDLIVVDMRMPSMDGYELLRRVKQMHPSTVRLILSGYAEEKLIKSALQNNLARVYLFKPWENKSLIRTIERALEVEELLSNKRVLDSMSIIKENILSVEDNRNICISFEQSKNIEELLNGITGNRARERHILDFINSSFWQVKFKSIEEAIERLGEFNIRNMLTAERLFDIMGKVNPMAKKELMLEYAVLSNSITDMIYKQLLNKDLNEMCALAGLLHDIGRYVPADIQNKFYGDLRDKEAFHQELSACVLKEYELPYPVIEAALFHHSPMDSRVINKEIVAVVHIASYYASVLTGESHVNSIDEGVFEYLGFSKTNFDNLIA